MKYSEGMYTYGSYLEIWTHKVCQTIRNAGIPAEQAEA
jgi:hypothetical protein